MKTRSAIVIVFLIAAAVFMYVYMNTRHDSGHLRTTAFTRSTSPQTTPSTPEPKRRKIQIYTVSESGGDANGLSAETLEVKDAGAPALEAMVALAGSANSPLPSGTKVLDIHIVKGLATVNFSEDFKKNFSGGDTAEAQAINGVLFTLGQFSSIKRVQILVKGSPIESLGGNLDISKPLDALRS